MASAQYATAPINGITTPSPEEDEDLYSQLLQLRDVVIAGKHASLKLPSSAIERLKASLIVPDAQARESQQSFSTTALNGSAFTTNQVQLPQSPSFLGSGGLPGLQSSSVTHANAAAQSVASNRLPPTGIDPIFLEKSPELVRAEGALKRARINHDLQAQVEQRKHSSRDRDPGVEASSPIDIDLVLISALERVKHVSGLNESKELEDNSSFDENDYYSSQVQSDWSSEEYSSKASDKATGAFTADFEPLDSAPVNAIPAARPSNRKEPSIPGVAISRPAKDRPHVYTNAPEEVYEVGDEDDEYTPPDAAAFDSFREAGTENDAGLITPPDDDNSDYEPGEITDSNIPTPQGQFQQPGQPSPPINLARNHLTHIAAPQPNRVSPLATAKGPNIELELVNGRPEVVQRPRNHSNNFHSRASTASPSGNGGGGGSNKKKKNKKRKRDAEPQGRAKFAKRRRDKQPAVESHAPPNYQEPYIKDEPVSPPPFANLPSVPSYRQPHAYQRPIEIESNSPGYAPQVQYVNDYPRSNLRYEHPQPASPGLVRITSPVPQRPVQRDTQDLRRVASFHVAKRLPSPQQRVYSPVAPYRTASASYADPQHGQVPPSSDARVNTFYQEPVAQGSRPYVREALSRSPPRLQEYREPYTNSVSSAPTMAPPAAPPRKIIVDQNGNRYYAADPAPVPTAIPVARASVAPPERTSQPEMQHARAPTHANFVHAQSSPQPEHYGHSDVRMAPPTLPTTRQAFPDQRASHADSSGYHANGYEVHPAHPPRFTEVPTSPIYQQVRGYEHVPPQQRAAEPTSPVYISNRSFSIRPEETPQVLRHASIAPIQYARRDAPAPAPVRAISVMPTAMPSQQHQRAYSQSSQAIRYVDQNGNEVFPREVRQVSEYRY